MKGYICGIWLLMYIVLIASTTKADPAYNMHLDYCKWGRYERITVGYHTAHPCMQIHCREDGTVTVNRCPTLTCGPNETLIWIPQSETRQYPDCCPRPICAITDPNKIYSFN